MSLLNFLDDKRISLGVNVFIAWVIATLFFLQTKTIPNINMTPVDLAIQAGLIYGYFYAIMFGVRLLLSPFVTLNFLITPKKAGKAGGSETVIGILIRLSEVVAIVIVFIYHPENLVYLLSPIGLILVLIFYVFRSSEKKEEDNSRESPTYVELVNSSVKVSNSHFEPLFIDFNSTYSVNSKIYGLPISIVNTKDSLPVRTENSPLDVEIKNLSSLPVKITESLSSFSVNVINDIGIRNDEFNSPISVELTNDKKSPLPVEVMNIVNTKQDEGS